MFLWVDASMCVCVLCYFHCGLFSVTTLANWLINFYVSELCMNISLYLNGHQIKKTRGSRKMKRNEMKKGRNCTFKCDFVNKQVHIEKLGYQLPTETRDIVKHFCKSSANKMLSKAFVANIKRIWLQIPPIIKQSFNDFTINIFSKRETRTSSFLPIFSPSISLSHSLSEIFRISSPSHSTLQLH